MSIAACALAALSTGQGWENFPALVWKGRADSRELVQAFGGTCVERTEDSTPLAERGLDFLVFNAPGRDDLHLEREDARYRERWQRWYDSRDAALCVREPCLRDPSTRERLRARLDESLARHAGNAGLGFSLGDEVGLTPGGAPEEVCLCAICRRAWSRAGHTDALDAASTEATLAALGDGRTEAIGPWLERRRFHQEALYEVLGELAARARAAAPRAPVGLLGIAGKTAFDGVDVPRALGLADFVECYAEGNARELQFTLRESRQRTLATVFADERGPDHSARQVWEHFVRGGDGVVLWSARELGLAPAQRDRLLRAVGDVRAARRELAAFAPGPRGVALVHSADSVAVAWLYDALGDGSTWPRRFASYQEAHGTLEVARRRWLELCEACGAQPGAIPIEKIGADTPQRFRVLVADSLRIVGSSAGLEAFVAAGGTLIVRGEVGALDLQGRKRTRSVLSELRARFPERVFDVPARVAAALGGADESQEAARELRALLSRCGVELRPWLQAEGGFEWLATWSRAREPGAIDCAALPEPRESKGDSARRFTWPERAEIAAPEGFEIVWVHPRAEPGSTPKLPPGDAALFRLVPRR